MGANNQCCSVSGMCGYSVIMVRMVLLNGCEAIVFDRIHTRSIYDADYDIRRGV